MNGFFQKQSTRSATTEILAIGVLLALVVNDWNKARVHQQEAEQAIINIIHEIESNTKLQQVTADQ